MARTELLELLLFKLEEEQLVLAGNRARWLAHAAGGRDGPRPDPPHRVLRAAEVEALGASLGLINNPSLADLADAVPAPWDDLLRQHRRAFLTLTAEISALASASRELLTTGQRVARETMLAVADGQTYGRRVRRSPQQPAPASWTRRSR